MNKYKVCSKCHTILSANTDNYCKKKNGKYNLDSICRRCRNNMSRDYYQDNRGQRLEQMREYYQDNKEELQQCMREHNRELRKTLEGKLTVLNSNSKKRFKDNYIHDITVEMYHDMINFFNNSCAYSGMKFDNNFSFEHIDCYSYKGVHAIWNIVPCISNINISKGAKDFLTWYKTTEYYSKERLDKIEAWQLYSFNKWKYIKGGLR